MAEKAEKTKKIGSVRDRIGKEYGDVFVTSSELKDLQGGIIPTTLSLDIALSGGLAEGTVTLISGVPKAGKSSLCLHIIAQAQKHFKKKCYFFDVECRLRTDLLNTIPGLILTEEQEKETGIPRLVIIRSTEEKFLTAEDFLNIITDVMMSEPNSLMVLDSIAALCTQDVFTSVIGESKRMAAIPSMMYEFFRKSAQVLPVKKSNLIAITHLQSSPNAYSGPVAVGGNAQMFFASNILRCTSAKEVELGEEKIGKDSEFRIYSSALGPPSRIATIYIRYGRGCDMIEDLVNTAETYGLIVRSGAWYQYNDNKFQGQENLKEYFRNNPDETKMLEENIRSIMLNQT